MSSHHNPGGDAEAPVASVLAQTWQTKIPVHLSLARDNISSPSAVRPIYLMAPRQGYLPVVASQAWPHLQHVLPSLPGRPGPPKPWFDAAGVPLKWHLPCGVLFDLLSEGWGRAPQLPWRLTVHYTHPPDSLGGWGTGSTPQAQFMNSLKEACFVCRGSEGSAAVMRMGSTAQDQLWAAVQAGDVAAYRAALGMLRVAPTPRQGQPANIPVRLLLRRRAPPAPTAPAPAAAASNSAISSSAAAATPAPAAAPGPAPPPVGRSNSLPSAGASASAVGAAAEAPGGRASGGGAAIGSASVMAAGGGGGGGGGGGVWESCVLATSRPIPAQQGGLGGPPTTLAHLLHVVLPHVFPPPAPPPASSATPAAATAMAAPAAAAPAASHGGQRPRDEAQDQGPVEAGGGGRGGSGTGARRDEVAPSSGQGTGTVAGHPLASAQEGALGAAQAAKGAGSRAAELGTVSGEEAGQKERGDAGEGGGTGGASSPPGSLQSGGGGDAGSGSTAGVTGPEERGAEGAGAGALGAAGTEAASGALATGGNSRTGGAHCGARSVGGEVGDGTAAPAAAAAAAPAAPAAPAAAWPACRVLVGGISPPLAAPLAWLHAAMHAPDLFLYVVVRMDGEADEEGEVKVEVEGARQGGR